MEYKRLTERRGKVIVDNCKNCENVSSPMGCTEHCCYEVMKNRLAELEDKIEQGTLIELPCILKPYYLCGEWYCKILLGFDEHSVPIMDYFYGKDKETAVRKAEKRLKELQNG